MNKIIRFFLIASILIGLMFRLVNLRSNTIFNWDQENSLSYPVKQILLDHHYPLIGASTSVGNLHLGPLYPYLAAPVFAVFHMDPIAAPVSAFVFSLMTILLGFYLTYYFLNFDLALLYTSIYSISALIISYDRIPWNVNLFPSASLLVFYGLWGLLSIREKAHDKQDKQKLLGIHWCDFSYILLGFGILLGINSHFSVIFLMLIVISFLLIHRIFNHKIYITILIVLLAFFPLILFELRHNFLLLSNVQTFSKISIIGFSKLFYNSISILSLVLISGGKVMLYDGTNWSQSGLTLILISFLYFLSKRTNISIYLKISFLYFIIYILGLTLYSGIVSEYYLVGLLPVFILGYAIVIYNLIRSKNNYQIILMLLFAISTLYSYSTVKQNTLFSLGYKQQVIEYIKNKYPNSSVQLIFDMNLSESFGFNYLLDYYKVNKSDTDNSPKIWISYPVDRFPGKPEVLFGDYAISTGENVLRIYSTKTVSFYNGLFNMRVPRDWNVVECPYTDMDSYILNKDADSSCSKLPIPKAGITIYNLPNCNIWEMSNLKQLDIGINIPFYVISSKNIPDTLSLNNYIVVTAFERNRCIIFNDLSGNQENFSKQFLEIMDSARKK